MATGTVAPANTTLHAAPVKFTPFNAERGRTMVATLMPFLVAGSKRENLGFWEGLTTSDCFAPLAMNAGTEDIAVIAGGARR
jgi:hypothetical protein